MWLTSLCLLFWLRGGTSDFFFSQIIHIYIHELLRYTEDGCCWFHFLVVGVCGYNTRRIKSLKTIVPLLSCTKNTQARSKAGMTGGEGSKLALSNPPHLKIQTQMYTNTIHNATVCVDFVKHDTFLGTSFVDNLPKSCFLFAFSPTKLLATSTRFIASVFKKYP